MLKIAAGAGIQPPRRPAVCVQRGTPGRNVALIVGHLSQWPIMTLASSSARFRFMSQPLFLLGSMGVVPSTMLNFMSYPTSNWHADVLQYGGLRDGGAERAAPI